MDEIVNIDTLIPDPQNIRKHNNKNLRTIQRSINQVGMGRSVVIDEDGVILCGNGTVEAAKKEGLINVRVIETDGTEIIAVKRTNLTLDEKQIMAITDNLSSDQSSFDKEKLHFVEESAPKLFETAFYEDTDKYTYKREKKELSEFSKSHPPKPLTVPEINSDFFNNIFNTDDEESKIEIKQGQIWYGIVNGATIEVNLTELDGDANYVKRIISFLNKVLPNGNMVDISVNNGESEGENE